MPLATGFDAAAGSLLVGIAVLLVLATLAALAPRSALNPRGLSFALSALACVGFLVLGIAVMASGGSVTASAGQVLGFCAIEVRYDALAGLPGGLRLRRHGRLDLGLGYAHARSHVPDPGRLPDFLASLGLVFGAIDAFAFLLAWELMALSSALLVVVGSPPIRWPGPPTCTWDDPRRGRGHRVAFASFPALPAPPFAAFGPAASALSPWSRPGLRAAADRVRDQGRGHSAARMAARAHPVAPRTSRR